MRYVERLLELHEIGGRVARVEGVLEIVLEILGHTDVQLDVGSVTAYDELDLLLFETDDILADGVPMIDAAIVILERFDMKKNIALALFSGNRCSWYLWGDGGFRSGAYSGKHFAQFLCVL